MEFKNILLIRTDRIGDVILTTPAITLLHQRFPETKIYFLTREYTAPLLKYHRFLHDTIIYDPERNHRGLKGHLKLARQLQSLNIDAAFLFFPQPALALTLWLARIPLRVGSGYRWYSIFLNHRIFEHRKHGKKHELEYNLSLLKDFVHTLPAPTEINFHFELDADLQKKRTEALKKIAVNGDYIIIHPGSGGSAPILPSYMYSRIVEYLVKTTDNDIILAGTASEKDLLYSICDGQHEKVHIIAGSWDLETYMAVISGCRLFISNSTGPTHIARAWNRPLLAFYCPALPYSPKRWGPYAWNHSVLVPPINVPERCNTKVCPHNNCLAQIPWENIKNALNCKLKTAD